MVHMTRSLQVGSFRIIMAFLAFGGCVEGGHAMEGAGTAINYIELRATDLVATKRFYSEAFGWEWIDYGSDYAAFTGAGVDGGVQLDEDRLPSPRRAVPSALVVLYTRDLEAAEARVRRAGGEIVRPIFAFPGGRRFHFLDPAGNELAVWSDTEEGSVQ